jgi:hypothetical protein
MLQHTNRAPTDEQSILNISAGHADAPEEDHPSRNFDRTQGLFRMSGIDAL